MRSMWCLATLEGFKTLRTEMERCHVTTSTRGPYLQRIGGEGGTPRGTLNCRNCKRNLVMFLGHYFLHNSSSHLGHNTVMITPDTEVYGRTGALLVLLGVNASTAAISLLNPYPQAPARMMLVIRT